MVKRIAALAVVLAIFASACKPNGPTSTKSSPSPSSSPVEAGSIVWTDCGGGFQCGKVQVPIDYSHPEAGSIGIALDRKLATDPAHRISSLLINPGGPGDSGVQFLRDDLSALTDLNQRFDLIGFDPRGVGLSSPVVCLNDAQKDAFNELDGVLDDPQEKQDVIQASKDFAAACLRNNAKILPFVDTTNAAKDMDSIRAAIGDSQLTYLGYSYGTFLGQMYAHLFPTHVRALVFDGVVDPSVSASDMLLAQLNGFERNYEAFLADCASRKGTATPCAYAKSGDPATKLNALLQRLDARPMVVGTRTLTRGLALTGVISGLYYQAFWQYLDLGLASADQGDGRLLIALADQLSQRNSDGTYSNLTDAIEAVDCLDNPVPTDISYYDQLGPSFAKVSPLLGPALQYNNLICAYWPLKPTRVPGPLTADGAPPILVVGGTNDPVTPYAWAQSVNKQLAGSVLLTRSGNGHTSGDNPCASAAENAYLINLTLPAAGTICN
jgi:pimeloyl-ACP methyl ester carboxylesterase